MAVPAHAFLGILGCRCRRVSPGLRFSAPVSSVAPLLVSGVTSWVARGGGVLLRSLVVSLRRSLIRSLVGSLRLSLVVSFRRSLVCFLLGRVILFTPLVRLFLLAVLLL